MKRKKSRRAGKTPQSGSDPRGETVEYSGRREETGRDHGSGEPGKARKHAGHLIGEDSRYVSAMLLVVALVAVLIRVIYLRADPPLGLSWSQALFTDGARAIDGARNKIMYGKWILEGSSPVYLFYPLSNLMAYIIYVISGIGLLQANLTGVLPSLGTLVLVYYFMNKSEGRVAGLIGLAAFAVPYVYVVYARTPLLESLQIFLLVGSFFLLLRGKGRDSMIAGILVGAAALLVKLHALHMAAVGVVFFFLALRTGREAGRSAYRLMAFFLTGLGIAAAVWAIGIYSVDPGAVRRYFESTVLVAQSGEYRDASVPTMLATRVRGFFHVGSGLDGFFRKMPVLSVLAAFGLISAVSGLAGENRKLRSWEMLAAVWFVVLLTALSLLSYRPLRYFIPLVPSMCLLAASVLIRLVRGERLLHAEKPRYFAVMLFLWLLWFLIHLQHDIIFNALQPHLGRPLTATQSSLLSYDFSILRQILIVGGVAAGLVFLFGRRLGAARWKFGRKTGKNIAVVAVAALVLLNLAKFADYSANRKYTIVEMAESLERVTGPGVFLVGDCATTLSLETDFMTMPTYGVLISRDEREDLEKYPFTHFLIRYPTLHDYLSENYPDFSTTYIPVSRYSLCGRAATVVRFEQWPAYPETYSPSRFEEGMFHLSRGDVNNALAEFEAFLKTEPDAYEAMFGSAVCLAVMGRQDEARAKLTGAIEIAPPGALEYHAYVDLLSTLLRGGGAGQ